jgi:hypothetical protein
LQICLDICQSRCLDNLGYPGLGLNESVEDMPNHDRHNEKGEQEVGTFAGGLEINDMD